MEQNPKIKNKLETLVQAGLCQRCGTCVGMCPKQAISFNQANYPEIDSSKCVECGLCLKVCSGQDFNLHHFSNSQYQQNYDFYKTHGYFEKSYLIASQDAEIRQAGSSGGFISQLLISLLERGEINGALVVASSEKELWRGKPIIAKSREEIISATKSKYAIASTNTALAELKKLSGKYAVVGLPCQIQAIRKVMELDKSLQAKIVLTLGLFCHSALEPELYETVWQNLTCDKNQIKRFNPRKGKHPGVPTLEFQDGSSCPLCFATQNYQNKAYQPNSTELLNIFFRLYTQPRCFMCLDALSEFADISVGDPYFTTKLDLNLQDGWSFVLARNAKALQYINTVATDLIIKEVPNAEALHCNQIMATNKKISAYRLLRKKIKANELVPHYLENINEIPKGSFSKNLKSKLDYLTHYFCFKHVGRKMMLKILLGTIGYNLLKINHFRKSRKH